MIIILPFIEEDSQYTTTQDDTEHKQQGKLNHFHLQPNSFKIPLFCFVYHRYSPNHCSFITHQRTYSTRKNRNPKNAKR